MHLSDGIMSAQLMSASWLLTAALASVSLKRLKADDLPKVALMTSAFFVSSLIHIPLGPTSVHLLLPGLVGVILGSSAFLSILIGVVLQCFLFQFGGVTAIGANTLIMGGSALMASGLFRILSGVNYTFAGGIAGGGAIIFSATFLALFLILSGSDFVGVAKLTWAAYLPVGIIEAIISAFTVTFLIKVKPELLGHKTNSSGILKPSLKSNLLALLS